MHALPVSELRRRIASDIHWIQILRTLNVHFIERSTGTLVSLCRVHLEKTPSCHFWNTSGRYYCHGCAIGGDKTDFVLEHLDSNLACFSLYEHNLLLQSFITHVVPYPHVGQLEFDFSFDE